MPEDEIMLTPAEEVALAEIVDGVRKPKRRQPTPAAEMKRPEPEPIDPADLNRMVVETDADLVVLSDPVRHQGVLRQFAKELWDLAYNQGAEDVSLCCGCTGKTTPNPFDPEEPDNG